MKYAGSVRNMYRLQKRGILSRFAGILMPVMVLVGVDAHGAGIDPSTDPLSIDQVRFWAYQIQRINSAGAVDALAATRYDMLVVEPTRTDISEPDEGEPWAQDFDAKAMVQQLKSSPASDGVHRKLVIAYIDIGEAESYRWYWHWPVWDAADQARNCDTSCAGIGDCEQCTPETTFPGDWKDFIVGCDPDGWEDNYPIAYWHQEWQDITINGYDHLDLDPNLDYNSILDEVIKDGFDGIYLDWVEAFDDCQVLARAEQEGYENVCPPGEDPEQLQEVCVELAMIDFIRKMRDYGRMFNPNFLVIQQNATSLIDGTRTSCPASSTGSRWKTRGFGERRAARRKTSGTIPKATTSPRTPIFTTRKSAIWATSRPGGCRFLQSIMP